MLHALRLFKDGGTGAEISNAAFLLYWGNATKRANHPPICGPHHIHIRIRALCTAAPVFLSSANKEELAPKPKVAFSPLNQSAGGGVFFCCHIFLTTMRWRRRRAFEAFAANRAINGGRRREPPAATSSLPNIDTRQIDYDPLWVDFYCYQQRTRS